MSDGSGQSSGDIDCLYCMDNGTIKRRYGTVGPGPAKIVKRRQCPMCSATDQEENGEVPHRHWQFRARVAHSRLEDSDE